jgi:hypothetical protein
MKKIALAGVCLVVMSVLGQPLSAAQMKVTLPHATSIGGVTLPAGECTIRQLNSDTSSAVLLIHSTGGASVTALVSQIPERNYKVASQPEVVLRRSRTKYALEQVWFPGMEYGYNVLNSNGAE